MKEIVEIVFMQIGMIQIHMAGFIAEAVMEDIISRKIGMVVFIIDNFMKPYGI